MMIIQLWFSWGKSYQTKMQKSVYLSRRLPHHSSEIQINEWNEQIIGLTLQFDREICTHEQIVVLFTSCWFFSGSYQCFNVGKYNFFKWNWRELTGMSINHCDNFFSRPATFCGKCWNCVLINNVSYAARTRLSEGFEW